MANLSASLSVDDRFKYHGSLLVPMVSLHQCLHACVRLCMMHVLCLCACKPICLCMLAYMYGCMYACICVCMCNLCVCGVRVYVNTDSAINAY